MDEIRNQRRIQGHQHKHYRTERYYVRTNMQSEANIRIIYLHASNKMAGEHIKQKLQETVTLKILERFKYLDS